MPETRDITLWELILRFFKWCGKGLKAFFIWIGELIKLSFRKWYIMLLFLVLCVGVGWYISRPTNRIYYAQGVMMVNGPTPFDVKEALEPLNHAMQQNLEPSLAFAQQLGLPFEEVNGLRWVGCFNVIDALNDSIPDFVDFNSQYGSNDTIFRISPFYLGIQIETKKLKQLPTIEKGIADFVNTNPAIICKYEAKKKSLEEELVASDQQLMYLDSLSKLFYFDYPQGPQIDINSSKSGTIIMGKRSIDLLTEDIFELIKHRQKVEMELSVYSQPVAFITHLSALPKAKNNRLLCVILGFLIGCILGLCTAKIVENRKQIREWLTTK
ncbi:MAG: hypothetical protein IKN91_02805 [Paludibacteraceae bacterium]|nr:hypothetical protein [Paludibacteraceae bacterium]